MGYDPRDELAFRACVASLRLNSSIELEIIPLRECDLRREGVFKRPYMVTSRGQMVDGIDAKPFSTQFSFTRFAIPKITNTQNWTLFVDADFMFRADVQQLIALADEEKTLMCVQHDYRPVEGLKFDGMAQQNYPRKNWSSMMLMRPAALDLSLEKLNTAPGGYLHSLQWVPDHQLGALPEEWNWLQGWSSKKINPKAVHYTMGTPDFNPNIHDYVSEWWEYVEAWKPSMNRRATFL